MYNFTLLAVIFAIIALTILLKRNYYLLEKIKEEKKELIIMLNGLEEKEKFIKGVIKKEIKCLKKYREVYKKENVSEKKSY